MKLTTTAGKRLLERLSLDVPWFIAGSKDTETEMILAIEAEAREQGKERATAGDAAFLDDLTADWEQHEREAVAAALARVRERVEKHIAHHSHEPGKNCVSAFCAAGLHRAVIAIIDEETAK